MVDTNSDPRLVDFPIPANDDATKSITVILDAICGAIKEGLDERKSTGTGKDEAATDAPAAKAAAPAAEAPAAEAPAATEETPVEAPAATSTEETND
jgi:small subunit ribosomal protein S2